MMAGFIPENKELKFGVLTDGSRVSRTVCPLWGSFVF